jgi:hypothetical protein
MERLLVCVHRIALNRRASRVLAHAQATSVERHRGKPCAVISLQLNLPVLNNESSRALRQRVRDEAQLARSGQFRKLWLGSIESVENQNALS